MFVVICDICSGSQGTAVTAAVLFLIMITSNFCTYCMGYLSVIFDQYLTVRVIYGLYNDVYANNLLYLLQISLANGNLNLATISEYMHIHCLQYCTLKVTIKWLNVFISVLVCTGEFCDFDLTELFYNDDEFLSYSLLTLLLSLREL